MNVIKSNYPYCPGNEALQSNTDLEVMDKYTGEVAARVAVADSKVIDDAIVAVVRAAEPMRNVPPYERQELLNHRVRGFEQRRDELAMVLCVEAGKSIKDSRGEAARLIDTFPIAAEAAVRIEGDVLNHENSERVRGFRGMVKIIFNPHVWFLWGSNAHSDPQDAYSV